jgi:hypothetical protein
MRCFARTSAAVALAIIVSVSAVRAQDQRAADTATPESIVAATYASIEREPGGDFDWDRFRNLFLPEARLIPNTEQRGGSFDVITPEGFIEWAAAVTTIGGPNDRGSAESGVHNVIEQYGDIAHVFSTYEKHYWGETEILGRGINSFQLVKHSGRWWIVGIVWDEDYAAGPIPPRYGGR